MAVLGSITVNEIEIMEVDASPKVSGVDASTGSIAVNTDGSFIYLKDGNSITDWAAIGTEFFYSITGANQTKNNATYSNVTELVSESLPIGTYIFNCYAVCQSTATAVGIGLRIGANTAVLGSTFGKWSITQAASGVGSNYEYDQTSATTNISSTAANTANADFLITGQGVFNITTLGSIAVQIRAENNNNVSIRTGSVLFLKRVA
jgi:hypothetical protein